MTDKTIMSDEKYPLIETGREEDSLFFSHNEFSESDDRGKACVGHLRGDFGSSGTKFWTSWFDHHEELKNQEFKDELDDVVNTLRKDGPLKDFSSMQRFCWEHPQARMGSQYGSENYGLRVDTDKYRYYLRFCPMRGNDNFYIYCYKAGLLKMPMPQFDLSSIGAVSAAAEKTRARANQEPDQDNYNAAWLHGYAKALEDIARQMAPQQYKKTDHKKRGENRHER